MIEMVMYDPMGANDDTVNLLKFVTGGARARTRVL